MSKKIEDCEISNYRPARTSFFNAQYKIRTETDMELFSKCLNLYNVVIKNVFNLNELFLNEVLNVEFSGYFRNEYSRTNLEFDKDPVRCAYLIRYSIVNSIAICHHFKHKDMLNQLEKTDTVRICCLGGGTGTEIVGICLAISDFLSSSKKKKLMIRICFTVVDICKAFEEWVVALVKTMRKSWNEKLDVRLRFVPADLTKRWPKEVHSALEKCDILTVVGLVSSLIRNNEDRVNKKDLKVVAGVVRRMKMDSWFFYLDYAGGGYYQRVQNRLRKYQYCEQRQSSLHQCHIVNEKIWEKAMGSKYSNCSSVEKRMMMDRSPNLSSGIWKICVPVLKPSFGGKPSGLTRRRNSGHDSSFSDN